MADRNGRRQGLQRRRASGYHGFVAAIDRKKGFEQGIAGAANIKIIRSQTGDFTRAKGKGSHGELLKAENGGKNICALYAHNDDMAVGAIQAIKEAGLKPGTDILVVSIDAVPDIFQAMAAGEANATVELTPNMAGPAFDALKAFKDSGTMPPKFIQTESKLFTQKDDPMKVYEAKKASATDLARAGVTHAGPSLPTGRPLGSTCLILPREASGSCRRTHPIAPCWKQGGSPRASRHQGARRRRLHASCR